MSDEDQLIELLFDRTASVSDRDDAAIRLGKCDSERVLVVLARAANDLTEHEIVRGSCGESIGEILARRGVVEHAVLDQLAEPAKSEALALLKATDQRQR